MTEKPPQRCSCGQELLEWQHENARIWCASLADLVAYRLGKHTQHEVYNFHGKRLWLGRCRFEQPAPDKV
jgi:hypothetical protein